MSRKKGEDEPEDPLDKALMDILRFERQSTEIDWNQYQQEDIKMRREILRQRGKELQTNFFTGMSLEETTELMKDLSTQRFALFSLIGNLVDKGKKLTPKELRKEVTALVKAVPFRDQSEVNKSFLDGLKTANDLQTKMSNALGAIRSRESSTEGSRPSGGKPAGGTSEEPSSSSQSDQPLLLAVNHNFGSAEVGGTITIPFDVSGGFDPVEFGVGGLPGLEGRITKLAPLGSSKMLEGEWTLTIPNSAPPGEHQLTLGAIDSKHRISKQQYFLTIRKSTP